MHACSHKQQRKEGGREGGRFILTTHKNHLIDHACMLTQAATEGGREGGRKIYTYHTQESFDRSCMHAHTSSNGRREGRREGGREEDLYLPHTRTIIMTACGRQLEGVAVYHIHRGYSA